MAASTQIMFWKNITQQTVYIAVNSIQAGIVYRLSRSVENQLASW